MHNGVVTAIARALVARRILALPFNFRGVGHSGGQHDDGRSEQSDVAGAVDWLLAQPQVDPRRVWLVGYSFGAWVGLQHATSDLRITAVAAVGLAAWHYDAGFYEASTYRALGPKPWQLDPDFLQSFTRPKLFVTGEYDSFAPPQRMRHLVDRLPPPKALQVVPGTDHFWQGHEPAVAELVAEFFAGLWTANTPIPSSSQRHG
jgi:alpha/beta superfamily hydrolase